MKSLLWVCDKTFLDQPGNLNIQQRSGLIYQN